MNKKKKVLHLVEAMGGGVFTYLVELANGMSDEFDVSIAFGMRKETPENYEDYFNEGIKLIKVENFTRSLNVVKDIKAYIELRKIVKKEKPDIIHLHSSKAGALGRLLVGTGKAKMFYTPHGYSFLMENESGIKQQIYKTMEKILGKRKCLTVACGKSEWEQSRIVTKNSTYISNGVNIDKLNANLINANEQNLEDFNIKKNVFTAYTVGRINYQKWPELFNEIAQKLPEMQFVWIGDGDMRDKLTADNIVITGWLEHKEAMELITKFDTFILASRYEGLPISLLEAMYMKKACVVSNVVGNRDVIKNDYNGYICDETDQFVEALKDIEKGNSDKLIEQAYSDILNEFNSKCLCNKYKEVYNESRSK